MRQTTDKTDVNGVQYSQTPAVGNHHGGRRFYERPIVVKSKLEQIVQGADSAGGDGDASGTKE